MSDDWGNKFFDDVKSREDAQRPVKRLVMRFRLIILRMVCWVLLPRDIWIGKHYGGYTQKWGICLGRLDNRGVLQGVLDKDVDA